MCFRNPLSKNAYRLPQQDYSSDEEEPQNSPSKRSGFVAIQMIELEMQLEQNCTLDTIMRLCGLYSQAIEFFDDKEDPKCFDIQNKLHKMLKRPEVIQILSNPITPSSLSIAFSLPEDKKSDFESRKKGLSQQLSKKLEEDRRSSLAGADMIVQETNKAQEVTDRIRSSFSKQEAELMTRRDQRRTSMRKRNSSVVLEIERSDVSAGGYRGNMQEEVEEFLENHFATQSHAISEINVRYETEINKLDGQGGVFAMVVEQLRKNKEDEVSAVRNKFEGIRKEAVGIIRKKYVGDFMY